jgi:hypothetical protein
MNLGAGQDWHAAADRIFRVALQRRALMVAEKSACFERPRRSQACTGHRQLTAKVVRAQQNRRCV